MKNLTTEEQGIRIDNAKAVLKAAGYFVDNLWHVEDVQAKFDCSPIDAMSVLNRALTNEATFSQVWFALYFHAEELGLTIKEE